MYFKRFHMELLMCPATDSFYLQLQLGMAVFSSGAL